MKSKLFVSCFGCIKSSCRSWKKFKKSKSCCLLVAADVSEAPILRAPFSLPFHRIFPNIIFYAYCKPATRFHYFSSKEKPTTINCQLFCLAQSNQGEGLIFPRCCKSSKTTKARQLVANEAKIFLAKEIFVIKKAANDAEEWNIGRQHRRR